MRFLESGRSFWLGEKHKAEFNLPTAAERSRQAFTHGAETGMSATVSYADNHILPGRPPTRRTPPEKRPKKFLYSLPSELVVGCDALVRASGGQAMELLQTGCTQTFCTVSCHSASNGSANSEEPPQHNLSASQGGSTLKDVHSDHNLTDDLLPSEAVTDVEDPIRCCGGLPCPRFLKVKLP